MVWPYIGAAHTSHLDSEYFAADGRRLPTKDATADAAPVRRPLPCSVCGARRMTWTGMQYHVARAHGKDQQVPTNEEVPMP